MSVSVFPDEDEIFDPDTLKMPESYEHRTACDVIGLAAVELLSPDQDVFRDMNWYPLDEGNAIAPDVFVLPAGALAASGDSADELPKSYRQDQAGPGPSPLVAIEVPSAHDIFVKLLAKIRRYQQLGVVVYLVATDDNTVLRYQPSAVSPDSWADKPIEELGGLVITYVDGELTVVMPDGTRGRTDHELMLDRERRAADVAAADAQAAAAEAQAAADAEIAALRQQLRDHGIDQ